MSLLSYPRVQSVRLGIDFGTTRTVVAAVDRGNYPVVSFETSDGEHFDWFPSVLAVCRDWRLYGWDAWAPQLEPNWTIIRSIKRVLEDAGPDTIIHAGNQKIPLAQVLREMAEALKSSLLERSSLHIRRGDHLEVMLGVPANANSNQRFLTTEAFRSAGFDVLGLLNEPSAASLEYAHKYKAPGRILVYDLGGGTFDASLVETGEQMHLVVASEGISTLGGDDFDQILADLALEAAGISAEDAHELTQGETFLLLEECREKKESLRPNTRKIVVDLEAVREGWGAATVPVADFYDHCDPLMQETLHLVEDVVAKHAGRAIDALYVTGGGSELPLVARVLREEYGRRVRRSAYTRSATAIGLAIQADVQAGYVLREKFSRYFGVWRETDGGSRIIFDPLFEKGTMLPAASAMPLRIARSYRPWHNVGHFRYLECSHLSPDGEPTGDITVWDEILFPFEAALRESADLSEADITRAAAASDQTVEECYTCDSSGTVEVAIRNRTAGYARSYRLGRWSSRAPATVMPGKPKRTSSKRPGA
jgi:molecular chaperone DnaK (HSP70)